MTAAQSTLLDALMERGTLPAEPVQVYAPAPGPLMLWRTVTRRRMERARRYEPVTNGWTKIERMAWISLAVQVAPVTLEVL